jgi:hypothetical protein
VGLKVGPKPKIWRVYARKRKRGDAAKWWWMRHMHKSLYISKQWLGGGIQ